MNLVDKIKDKTKRHRERSVALGYKFVVSDGIAFVNVSDWDRVAAEKSIFLSRAYLSAIERCSPENTEQRYAIAYENGIPIVLVVCQVAETSGERLTKAESGLKNVIARNYKERVLVCGNLVSSGLHGVAFADHIGDETGWRIVAELLYKVRRAEKLNGKIDFVCIKDIKGEEINTSAVVERYSYRRIKTDPDMVLELGEDVTSFEHYLRSLNSKYRSRIKKIITTVQDAGLECARVTVDEQSDRQFHSLYLQVESRSATRLATLPPGYFLALQEALGDKFCCFSIHREGTPIGFISVIKDGEDAIAYYVGMDYTINSELPLYFRLLQLVIQGATEMGCKRVLFGRTASEPKANLGAKPVDTYVWARHRVPVVNFFVRGLFGAVTVEEAPERAVTKQ